MNKKQVIFFVLILMFLFECTNNNKKTTDVKPYSFSNPPQFRKDKTLKFIDINEKTLFQIDIEVVKTDEERMRGLMYRNGMAENRGMLFVMEVEKQQSFWMHNTIMSLDIIYINKKYEIVDIYKHTKILDDTSLPSKAPALYVVEINAGLCSKYGIKIGDKVQF